MQKGYLDKNTLLGSEKERYWEIPVSDKRSNFLRIKQRGSRRRKGETHKTAFTRKRLVWGVDSTKSDVVFAIEELKEEDGNEAIRFGYWTWTRKKGSWTWAQFAPMIQLSDLHELLNLAKSNQFYLIPSESSS